MVGPSLSRRGGVAHHMRTLLNSPLNDDFDLCYFRVGSDYRDSHLKIIIKSLLNPWRFMLKLWNVKPDIVHFNPSFDHKSLKRELIMIMLCKLFGYSSLVQFHGGNLIRLMKNDFLPFYIKLILKWSAHFIVLTEMQKQPLLNFVAENKITVIPNMVDASQFIVKNKKINNIILFMSRIDIAKGVYDIFEAIPEVLKNYPHARFIFAGEGPDKAKLELLCCSNGLIKHVKFLGYIDDEQKVNFLAQGDLFLFPSHLNEGIPYSLLEAMAAGLPVIATSVGAIPEIIENGKHGILIPREQPSKLAESIIQLLKNKRRRGMMVKQNRFAAETKYDIKIVCEKFKSLYKIYD